MVLISLDRSRQNAIKEHTLEWIEIHFPGLFKQIHFGNHFALHGESRPKSEICRCIQNQLMNLTHWQYSTWKLTKHHFHMIWWANPSIVTADHLEQRYWLTITQDMPRNALTLEWRFSSLTMKIHTLGLRQSLWIGILWWLEFIIGKRWSSRFSHWQCQSVKYFLQQEMLFCQCRIIVLYKLDGRNK